MYVKNFSRLSYTIYILPPLTDDYFFGTITELLVLPEYRKHGIGSKLLHLAKETSPTMLYFGSQPGVELFYEKNGCEKSLQSYIIEKDKS